MAADSKRAPARKKVKVKIATDRTGRPMTKKAFFSTGTLKAGETLEVPAGEAQALVDKGMVVIANLEELVAGEAEGKDDVVSH